MLIQTKMKAAFLCAASIVALTSAAKAQANDAGASPETVVVTGSRVISDAANSPTPLTVVSTAQLLATTPSNIPDALNKLPVFSGSSSPQTINNASQNSPGNVLNLRNFGSQRTLVLFDGHRVTPSNADGTIDIDTLPQMLMSRVDVVTGGASAVYGSDAVTGVVNFVLDKHFSGIKFSANAGISNYADAASYQMGIAAGTDLFGGRGHVEGSLRHFHQDAVRMGERPFGSPADWVATGAGTAASHYVNTRNGTLNSFAFGGKITCAGTAANPCAANGMQFISNGVIGPFNKGMATGTANVSSGGDGAHTTVASVSAMVNTDESFGRFSYNLDDTTSIYVQAIAAQSYDYNVYQNNYIQTGTVPNVFLKTNPYLPAAAQAMLAGGTASIFQLAEYFNNQGGTGFISRGIDRDLSVTAGLDGIALGKYDWDLFYTHGESRVKVDDPHNENNARMYAAEDAVTNSAGQVVCQVSTTPFANRYPGCVPMNPFGPSALTSSQYNYFVVDSAFTMSQVMDDVGGSISGGIFDLPAGPVKAALSAEARWLTYGVTSNAPPGPVDCTGLRLCNSAASNWLGNVAAPLAVVSENVWEFAGEADVPLLKDLPAVQSLSVNLAGRYTDYSTSGSVQTWKVGLDYHVTDDLRFRATNSIDIRAPTLNDLFSPLQLNHAGFSDIHTGNIVQNALTQTQGNPNLIPEVARTYTAGVVLTPAFIPGLTASIDYYNIVLKNAIGSIGGGSANIQQLCETSGGTSPYCSLYVRPLPFSNTTPANYPTAVITEQLNTAYNSTEGWDIELDYGFQLADVMDTLPGSINLRMLTNIQPFNQSEQYPGAPLSITAVPKGRVTSFVAYNLGAWTFNLQDRWYSGFPRSTQPGLVFFEIPRGKSLNYVDLTVSRKFLVDGNAFDGYLSITNVENKKPPIEPNNSTTVGLWPAGMSGGSGSPLGIDKIGRYFTIGVRASL